LRILKSDSTKTLPNPCPKHCVSCVSCVQITYSIKPSINKVCCNSLRTPDAIQIASDLQSNATALLTNDIRLPVLPAQQMLILDHFLTKHEIVFFDKKLKSL